MKKFLIYIVVFALPVIPMFLFILGLADGYTDPFYLRFTTPRQKNMILGTSRAAQGLQPRIFTEVLDRDFYNYSFTVVHSPYGPTYLNSIKKKVDPDGKEGIFIVTVDPWSISSTTADPNDSTHFEEVNLCVGNTPFVHMNPNYWYLIENLGGDINKVLNNDNSALFLNDDGWLEVTVPMDTASVNKRIQMSMKHYAEDNLPIFHFSPLRLEYLKKTIRFLNGYGKVYLVRLPVYKRMLEIERELMPDFSSKMDEVAPLTEGYLDMTGNGERYRYTDGNHLYKESGEVVSREIGEWILGNR